MSYLLIENIKQLVQVQHGYPHDCAGVRKGEAMKQLGVLENAWLLVRDGRIAAFGTMDAFPFAEQVPHPCRIIDAAGRMVFPSYCDCHTHIVYAGSRVQEFADKLQGLSYEQIAARGGGILNSAELLQRTSEDALFAQACERMDELIALGTGAVEIKSGYGLSVDNELKMLRVIKRLGETYPIPVKATFLGAHAVPAAYVGRREAYVDLIVNEMIPAVAQEGLAQYVDVFCERGFFTVADTERIFAQGLKYGLRPKVHANQMDFSGGVEVGIAYGAISVDHLEHTGAAQWDALAAPGVSTLPVLLPGATFFLNMEYANAREMLLRGLPLVLASNYNPGSCPMGNMQFITALACLKYGLSVPEALNAATLNGAYAMGLEGDYGSIAVGKVANLFITKPMPSYEFPFYALTTPYIDTIILNGEEFPRP